MRLTDDQLHALRSYIRRNAPSIDRLEERVSRRIEGEVDTGHRDARGYRNVVVYIQQGLGSQDEILLQVLHIVAATQSNYRLKYPVHLFSFGWDNALLHHNGKNHQGSYNVNISGWARELCALAGTGRPSSPAVIPSLFPFTDPYGHKHNVEQDDLLIFFCNDQNVHMLEQAKKVYNKRVARNSIWVFYSEELIEIALGDFIPGEQPSAATILEMGSEKGTKMIASRSRGLSDMFMEDLQEGILAPLLKLVKADHTLSLNIRNGYINIYYRGGSILKVSELDKHKYRFSFDSKYENVSRNGLSALPLPKSKLLPNTVDEEHVKDVDAWVASIPLLKCTMDIWFGQHPKLEREFQQLVERINNHNPATDYFICDIEYTSKNSRADLIALHWPSRSAMRKRMDCASLAIIEMKQNDGALAGTSGLIDHIENVASIKFEDLREEMKIVFNQRVELGLIQCHSDANKAPVLQNIDRNRLDYIILLSDHDPESQILLDQLSQIPQSPHFTIKVAAANFMGYGLYEQCIFTLAEFKDRFPEQFPDRFIGNGKGKSVQLPCESEESFVTHSEVVPNDQQKTMVVMCERCGVHLATERRLDTWTANSENPNYHDYCQECSRNIVF